MGRVYPNDIECRRQMGWIMTDPRVTAFMAVVETMGTGSSKGGRHWMDESRSFHLLKAIRHATTALMIDTGVSKPDGEDHAKLALTRLAMALAII